MSQKTIYHNGKIATNSIPYFPEAMAVGDGKVLATGTSSRRYTTVTKSTSSRIAAVT
jgi:predicted amidohydrolase YtcJ